MRFIYTKAFALFAACLVIVAFLVILQLKGWLDPIRTAVLSSPRPVVNLVKNTTKPVKGFFGTIYQLKNISQENTNLRLKVSELQQSLVQADQQARENDALRKELGFVKISKFQLASCTVLSDNSFGLSDSLVLNCGTEDGITAGQAVISQGYLVGKIVYAGKNSSTALLTVAADFSTDAKISQTNATSIVRGSFGSGSIVDQVPQSSPLEKGWLVVTAGINQQVPKNILIGEVGDMLSSGNDLFKKAVLISPIDFSNLEFVFVVKG